MTAYEIQGVREAVARGDRFARVVMRRTAPAEPPAKRGPADLPAYLTTPFGYIRSIKVTES